MWFTPWTMKEFFLSLFGRDGAIYLSFLFLLVALFAICGETARDDVAKAEKECLNVGKYRRKPVVIEAVQWFEDGDHPDVKMIPLDRFEKLQRGDRRCKRCELVLDGIHGEIEQDDDYYQRVCPGDFVVTDPSGLVLVMTPDHFSQIFEKIACENDD